jgi:glc operon protein GlcG
MAAAEHEATSNKWKVAIAICDSGGTPLLVKRLDGAFPASYEIAVGKAKTAAHFCRPTGQLEAATNVSDGSSRTALLSAPYVLMRGGLPVFVDGNCAGSVGVSGVTPDQDEQIASAAASILESIASRL